MKTKQFKKLATDRVEHLLVAQRKLLEMIATGISLGDCLSALCNAISRLGDAKACILLADDQRGRFSSTFSPGLHPSFAEALKGAPIGNPPVGTCAEAVMKGLQVRCKDMATDTKWAGSWRSLCLANQVRACVSEPIRAQDGTPLGCATTITLTP